ncbi:hypothetical protein KW803_03275 [Candidatus Saccharibacteria bacterium]|nr:hypothetical protein [Candidatus Saccharibacteria bacterium]
MATEKLDQIASFNVGNNISALTPSADFLIEDPKTEILDSLLNIPIDESLPRYNLNPVFALHDHLKHALSNHYDWTERRRAGASYADSLHEELEVDETDMDLSYQLRANLVMARLYLSNVSALGYLGNFVNTKRLMTNSAPETKRSKEAFLESRKVLQDDVDYFYNNFAGAPNNLLMEALLDTANLARLLMHDREWVNTVTHDYTHQFIGSILSERLVKVSLQNHGYPDARYGTADEDSSPIMADIVLPNDAGDLHVQVKMKWTKPTDMQIMPERKPMHVVVPMHNMRDSLTKGEQKRLAKSVTQLNQKTAA